MEISATESELRAMTEAINSLNLFGKLLDNQYCVFRAGEKVKINLGTNSQPEYKTGRVLGTHFKQRECAVLFDDGTAEKTVHISKIVPI
jgi:hypothetical protein